MGNAKDLKLASQVKTALLLVDIQQGLNTDTGYFGTERSTPDFEDNVAKLLRAARTHNRAHAQEAEAISIIHVIHNSSDPTSPLWPEKATNRIQACAAPDEEGKEPILRKSAHSAFVGTDLEQRLREQGIRQLFIFGISSAHCVSTTARQASDMTVLGPGKEGTGSGICIVSDASAAFDLPGKFDAETVHSVNLASLDGEFVDLVTTEEVLKQVIEQ